MDNQKYVCSACAGNSEVKNDAFRNEEKIKCSYCGQTHPCITIDSLADIVDENYRDNYEQCDTGSHPSEIISELLELDESAGKLDSDLVAILYDRELLGRNKGVDPIYDEEMTYCTFDEKRPPIIDGSTHKELWDIYYNQIKHRTRYFNSKVIKWLDNIFLDLDKLQYQNQLSPIRDLSPTDSEAVFYRARHAATTNERIKICCHSSQELNAPPTDIANSGRMNPIGISVFYAAFDRDTCIAELRLPVGEEAISAEFKLKKPITVLDLTALENIDIESTLSNSQAPNNEFDCENNFEDRLAFLRKISKEISKPVSPSKEKLEYMPTQAFAEYLAHHYKRKIDAIIYYSTQTNSKGKNIVFLGRSAGVISEQVPKSGKYKDLFVTGEYLVSTDSAAIGFDHSPQWGNHESISFSENYEYNEDRYLSFVVDSLKLHRILAVNYEVECFHVRKES